MYIYTYVYIYIYHAVGRSVRQSDERSETEAAAVVEQEAVSHYL